MKKDIRLSILKIENEKSCGGCIWFKGATIRQLKELFEAGCKLDCTHGKIYRIF